MSTTTITTTTATTTSIAISSLIDLDNRPAPHALCDAIGDQYLYDTNRIFANVRDVAVHFGYRFSQRNTKLWRDYQVLPLLTLYRIIRGKVIPYTDNRSMLECLSGRKSKLALPEAFIVRNIKPNYNLHEASHCIASQIFRQYDSLLASVCRTKREQFVLKEILSESFANTVETIAVAVEPTPLSDIFYALNSYMQSSEKRKEILDRARATYGDELSFVLLLLCYFQANLTLDPPSENTHADLLEAANIPISAELDTEVLAGLINIGFALNLGFRENTTPTYFDLLGCQSEYRALGQERWLGKSRNQEVARQIGSVLADVALRGVGSSFVSSV
jgi:hypothetical protein